jgi:hypothetical protein
MIFYTIINFHTINKTKKYTSFIFYTKSLFSIKIDYQKRLNPSIPLNLFELTYPYLDISPVFFQLISF